MNLADKLAPFEKIKTRDEQLTSPPMRFPVYHQSNVGCSFSTNDSSHASLSTRALVEATIIRAFEKAIEYADEVGMMDFLRKQKLSSITAVNDTRRYSIASRKTLMMMIIAKLTTEQLMIQVKTKKIRVFFVFTMTPNYCSQLFMG